MESIDYWLNYRLITLRLKRDSVRELVIVRPPLSFDTPSSSSDRIYSQFGNSFTSNPSSLQLHRLRPSSAGDDTTNNDSTFPTVRCATEMMVLTFTNWFHRPVAVLGADRIDSFIGLVRSVVRVAKVTGDVDSRKICRIGRVQLTVGHFQR